MSESRRRKLSLLTRSLARGDLRAARGLLDNVPAGTDPAAPSRPMQLAEACPGQELMFRTPLGDMPCWQIRKPLTEGDEIHSTYSAVLRGARHRFDELKASAALCHVANGGPGDLLFMDLETCGFSGCPIFLVGLMGWQDEQLVVQQYLARDYSEEAAICQGFWDRYDASSILVTFNGKSYDINMLKERSAFHAIELPIREIPHLDLLHESRRFWKNDLPNCKLQTLEWAFTGRRRTGDIPGSQIPEAYHAFVDSADARQMRDILHHNFLDLVTMAHLVCALLTGSAPAHM
ncbi:MAG: ribonuclease H-like domain-containing protein [Phycisphaerae bacterium]